MRRTGGHETGSRMSHRCSLFRGREDFSAKPRSSAGGNGWTALIAQARSNTLFRLTGLVLKADITADFPARPGYIP
ncbi:hypothetical protein ASD32_00825 [Rhizobium sp. Root483D2]|nr:hypothetical protein ASD32_00825 [Rhizobium sp. Root483D2]